MTIKISQLCTLLALAGGFLHAAGEEEHLSRRVQAHLTIRDLPAAVVEARQALQHYPNVSILHEAFIRALACAGEEGRMSQAWENYVKLFPDKALNRELIEEMAWGVLHKAAHSSSLIMRQMALLAALFSQIQRALPFWRRACVIQIMRCVRSR